MPDSMSGCCTCLLQLGLKVFGKGLFIHFLQADDVSMETQQLLQDEGPAVLWLQKPTHSTDVSGRASS